VHHYILEHLDEALPTAKVLAMRFGVEEYHLKSLFKAHFGLSMYQFYQTERLKKGYQLILTTQLQLKEIAFQCGFTTYLNFYKAFKKAYGIAPSALLRPH
jgi:AraC-like DNA-binding protein